MKKIDFYEVDPDTFEDIQIGTVTIDGDKVTADSPDLQEIVDAAGSASEVLAKYSDWSNGYLRSELE